MLSTLKKERPLAGLKYMKILHDNAQSQVHKNVINFLNNEGITIIDYLPYSPDLALCDFRLFDYIKQRLTSQNDA